MEIISISLVARIFWGLTALFFLLAAFVVVKQRIVNKEDANINNSWLKLGMVCMGIATILQLQ
jgi:uncharacterized membrane protein YjfL (UPF0719 family)